MTGTGNPQYVSVLWPNGWMDQDATWYGVRLGTGVVVLILGPSSPTERDTALTAAVIRAPTFRPMCIMAKRSPVSSAAEISTQLNDVD